jgi:hypothetical protein
MPGTNRVRFCGQCRQHVYNLSAMSREAADMVLLANEGRLCVRFFQRPDGTVLTRDCLARVRAFRRRLVGGLSLAAALFLVMLEWAGFRDGTHRWRGLEPFRTLAAWTEPERPCIMGGREPPANPGGAGPQGLPPPAQGQPPVVPKKI